MDDEYVVVAEEAAAGGGQAAVPGVYWVEYMPFLKYIPSWVPGTKSRRTAEAIRPLVVNMRDKPYAEVKAEIVRSSCLGCREIRRTDIVL